MYNYDNSAVLPFVKANPVALYNSEQVYAMEQAWFAQGYDSFALMQQAAWQMSQYIIQAYHLRAISVSHDNYYQHNNKEKSPRANIWAGNGNNGGDGWLVALYLQQAGWKVMVMAVNQDKDSPSTTVSDAKKAQQMAIAANCPYQRFEDKKTNGTNADTMNTRGQLPHADVYIDAIFGIGLDRKPMGIYQQAVNAFNQYSKADRAWVIAIDVPSGLMASTGQVFDCVGVRADVTLCLIARKFGLHTKDGMDYAGTVIDIPLIPYEPKIIPKATLLTQARAMYARWQNSHKGSYGHVLIIGGNRIDGSQGMGGAAILSASSAMAAGAGKITVACHQAFHGALLTSLPDAMTIDLHDKAGVEHLIQDASVIAIGMGLGRDKKARKLFIDYLKVAITYHKAIIIDADGLYHLADLHSDDNELVGQLKEYSKDYKVCLTPHSGEAARLLHIEAKTVETDRLAAISQCSQLYGGNWVLKGAGSLVLEQLIKKNQLYVCGVGNAGMATAGMGDVLSGVVAGLLAQQDLTDEQRSLSQAVLIHGLAGDTLVGDGLSFDNLIACPSSYQFSNIKPERPQFTIGQRGLQAQDMPAAIRHVMHLLTTTA